MLLLKNQKPLPDLAVRPGPKWESEFATRANRAVMTLNRLHFIRLHQQQPDHAGIIVCKFDPDCDGQAERIHKAIGGLGSLAGQLIRVNRV